MKRRRFLEGLAVASLAPCLLSCARDAPDGAAAFKEEAENTPLVEAAASKGRIFGSAVNTEMLDPRLPGHDMVLQQCASMTSEWSFKWDRLAPARDLYEFSDADQIADLARANGKRMRGHTLLWHLGMPDWANALVAETREWAHIRDYFQTVMPRYADIVDEWDVVNEPIDIGSRSDGLRENQFLHAFGRDYIEWALWTARENAPQARLFINEYGLEYSSQEEGQRRLDLLRLIERLLSRDAPLHGVGLQAHLDLRKGKIFTNGIFGLLRDISDFGLQVSITELDVREQDRPRSLESRDRAVADEVSRYLETVLDFPSVNSVTTWGLSDRDSWLTYREDGRPDNRGLPYDKHWRRKPMRTAIEAAFRQSQALT